MKVRAHEMSEAHSLKVGPSGRGRSEGETPETASTIGLLEGRGRADDRGQRTTAACGEKCRPAILEPRKPLGLGRRKRMSVHWPWSIERRPDHGRTNLCEEPDVLLHAVYPLQCRRDQVEY